MLPDSIIQAPNLDEWLTRAEAAAAMKIHVSATNDAVVKYRIVYQRMFGRTVYNRDDCERAAEAIAQMRAEREAKRN